MTLSRTLLRVAEAAINESKERVSLKTKSWRVLHEEYNIGLVQGYDLKLTAQDRARLEELIRLEMGLKLQETAIADLSAMNREEALAHTYDEKLAGKKVKAQRLAFKVLAGQRLHINQQQYNLPGYCHIDMSLDQLHSIEHSCIIIVENYRCFDQLQKIKLNLPSEYKNPLVIYRGDNVYSEQALRQLLKATGLPVIAMFDIDLQSLLMAYSFPYVLGLMCVSLPELDDLLHKGNAELYTKQLPGCKQVLDSSEEPVIKSLWTLLCKHQKVWVQEHDLGANYELSLMS
jgi:hypothetical protein